jgi:outer membrane lipoprotein SlyB
VKWPISCLLAGGLLLAGCSGPNGQISDQTRTVAEGAGLGAVLGAIVGAVAGGQRGAALGAAIGVATGGIAGAVVASQKNKYATLEQHIADEHQISAQATATAQSQTAASAARLRLVNVQLAELGRMQGDRARARQTAATMLSDLRSQRAALEASKTNLETRISDQQASIAQTEREIGANDPRKAAELQQWKADVPTMRTAVDAMTNQIADVSSMEAKVRNVGSFCC